jgi:hypothetical protein
MTLTRCPVCGEEMHGASLPHHIAENHDGEEVPYRR